MGLLRAYVEDIRANRTFLWHIKWLYPVTVVLAVGLYLRDSVAAGIVTVAVELFLIAVDFVTFAVLRRRRASVEGELADHHG